MSKTYMNTHKGQQHFIDRFFTKKDNEFEKMFEKIKNMPY